MDKRIKLKKNGLMLVGLLLLAVVIFVVYHFATPVEKKIAKEPQETLDSLVVENQVLKVQLLDFVSTKSTDDKYQEKSITIESGEEIQGYTMTTNQSFDKVLQLLPPDDNSPLLNNSSEKPTHEAYVLVLTGDIALYKDIDGNDIYKVVNGHVDCFKQSLLLEDQYDSLYISSIDNTKEKMVKVNEYQEAMNDVTKYQIMLNW